MKEELTREEAQEILLFAQKTELASSGTVVRLATALLEEMDKPKVWDGAPEWANSALVRWFKPDYMVGIDESFSKLYTRELPKTRARIMAEEIASAKISNEKDLVDIIEKTINTHMKELKGEE